jgi:hypothetical protein
MNAHKSHENGKIFIYFCIQIYYLYKSETHTQQEQQQEEQKLMGFKKLSHSSDYLSACNYLCLAEAVAIESWRKESI